MKKTMLNVFATVCVALVMVACSSSSDKDQPIAHFTGKYQGELNVTLNSDEQEEIEFPGINEIVHIEQGATDGQFIVSIKNFSFNNLILGDIVVPVDVVINGSSCTFTGVAELMLDAVGKCSVKVEGGIKNEKLALDIDVDPEDLPFTVGVNFNGKLSSSSENEINEPLSYFKGFYEGKLIVGLENPGEEIDPFPAVDERIVVDLGETDDELIISLKEFNFGDFKLGDINMPVHSKVKGNLTSFTGLKDLEFDKIGLCKVEVKGSIRESQMELNIAVQPVNLPFAVDVQFDGNRLAIGQLYPKMKFDEWVVQNPSGSEETHFIYPINEEGIKWGSSDGGVVTLLSMDRADKFTVTASDDAVSGKSARIESIDTKGYPGFLGFPSVPKVTSGSLFFGSFNLDFRNPLKSTKFGIPFIAEPIAVKGFYKYSPGKVYYHCPNPDKSNIVQVDTNKVDLCAINAVLYEVSSFDATDEILTGVDVYTSDKVVATALLADGSAKAEYTPFEIKFEYKEGKQYDEKKKYRLALIFSSSKDGDSFSGAPGSLLFVDEVEIITK